VIEQERGIHSSRKGENCRSEKKKKKKEEPDGRPRRNSWAKKRRKRYLGKWKRLLLASSASTLKERTNTQNMRKDIGKKGKSLEETSMRSRKGPLSTSLEKKEESRISVRKGGNVEVFRETYIPGKRKKW